MGMSSAPQAPPPTPTGYPTPPQRPASRPTGVTILAILEILGGLLLLFGAAALFAVSAIAGSIAGVPMVGAFGAGLGAFLVILALLSFAVAYSFWTGKSWGWWLGLILAVLQIISGIITFPAGILDLVIGFVILYYLTRPHVKVWFHEA
ncbi:MAG: hypothetical protein ACRECH_06960 [Nitrososphaerales archaeon]